jgi:hypothetical protein
MDALELEKKSFWKTKLFYAATAEVVMIAFVYGLVEILMKNKMFAMGMAIGFSIFSIYIFGPVIGWFQVVIIRTASFVSIIEGITHNYLRTAHIGIRLGILIIGISIPIFLTAFLWAKNKKDSDIGFQKDDYCEQKQISQFKAVVVIILVMFLQISMFYFL